MEVLEVLEAEKAEKALRENTKVDTYCLPINGILVENVSNVSIERITMQIASEAGIVMWLCSSATVKSINISKIIDGHGVKVIDSTEITISLITISDVMHRSCVWLSNVTNMTINSSHLTNCGWGGVQIDQGTNATLIYVNICFKFNLWYCNGKHQFKLCGQSSGLEQIRGISGGVINQCIWNYIAEYGTRYT